MLLVEEAGQVLEAHVLGSLVPSVEHLVLIGDPLQLRPTLNNFCMFTDTAPEPNANSSFQPSQWTVDAAGNFSDLICL